MQNYFEILADFDTLPEAQQNELRQVNDLINNPDASWAEIMQEGSGSYIACSDLVEALEQIGWTCDYGLDGQPIDLQPLKTM
jgi:hypothetical protein